MLTHLSIKNYALIRQLELEPSGSLNVITGETGAGKSIMLGAIGLLLGDRADTKVLWNPDEKCIVEGTFNVSALKLKTLFRDLDLDYEPTSVIRREINPGGKSRAFVNDTPVTLDALRRIGQRLIDVHSQHETLQFSEREFQLSVIDAYARLQNDLEAYTAAWRKYQELKDIYEQLLGEAETLKEEADFVKFQLDELSTANLVDNEQEKLEAELKIAEHAEDIKSKLQQSSLQLNDTEWSVLLQLNDLRARLQSLAAFGPAFEKLYQRINSTRIELQDVADELEREESKVEFDPHRTEDVKERLSLIYQLQQKHRKNSISELLALQHDLQQRAHKTDNLDEALRRAEQDLNEARKEVEVKAAGLSAARTKTFSPLSSNLISILQQLGIPDAQILVDHQKKEPGKNGIDQIEILFSANKGIAPRALGAVASGGEFSRLMFAVKFIMAEKTAMPTLVLDEIDTGVSGEIAIRLGKLMKVMAERHQVIAISHLPQIAAKAHTHYFVYKNNAFEKTVSEMRPLSESERVEEIAKMIGGNQPSDKARENAVELMQS